MIPDDGSAEQKIKLPKNQQLAKVDGKELKEGDKIAIPGDRPFTTGMQVRVAQPQ